MSARKSLIVFTLIMVVGVLLILPGSLYAAGTHPTHPSSTTLARPVADSDTPILQKGKKPIIDSEEGEQFLLERNADFLSKRLAGTQPLSIEEAASQLAQAQLATAAMKQNVPARMPAAYSGVWSSQGPNPILQVERTDGAFIAVSGRIGAALIMPNGRRIIGGAQGGIWTWNQDTSSWIPHTDQIGSLAIGSLAYAPSNPDIVYAGTGEGELSGDSYAGKGVLKSTDGGSNWYPVSKNALVGVSITKLAVDPTNENHLYAAVLRGRGGVQRVTHPTKIDYGVYESTDGAVTWSLKKGYSDPTKGATDLVMDPQNPQILYASFWGVGIFKTTDGGNTWNKAMNGLPTDAVWGAQPTRFSLGISHPQNQGAVLYTGFTYTTTGDEVVPARVWKSTDDAANWTILPGGTSPDNVEDYCAQQCWYDNVIGVSPDDPNVLFVLGQFDYGIGSGGIYRSEDGGQTWRNLGAFTHPDFHAVAFNPSNTQEVIIGNDGGVWVSEDRGGRPSSTDAIDATTWENLNGTVDPNTGAVLARTGLEITQFSGMSTVPYSPNRLWAGSQDNGTERRSSVSETWADVASGDGGHTAVDPDGNFLYGTYYGISPYRFDISGGLFFFSNQSITNGIDLTDRSEFYTPYVLNKLNPDQLFLGTYRLYRTDNARAANAGDVLWHPISGDLTSGCTGSAPNGARGCLLSAVAVSNGGHGVWVGTDDGYVQFAADGATSLTPKWQRKDKLPLPGRPVGSIWVDQSDSRFAVVAFAGFNQATPGQPGHMFKTTDAGKTWTNISGNLPNVPVNEVIVDPSYPNTIYAGTDVGPMVTSDGGNSWLPLGTNIPIVSIEGMDLDPANRVLAVGTHGRGAWRLDDPSTVIPALVISKSYPNIPVGPNSDVTFSLTVQNIGNGDATNVTIQDVLPAKTTFVSASDSGTINKDKVSWRFLSIPAGSSQTVQLTLHISSTAKKSIKNKNYHVTSAQGIGAKGSPVTLKLAPPKKTTLSPKDQTNGNRPGQAVEYPMSVQNLGSQSDTYKLAAKTAGGATNQVLDAGCSTPITQSNQLAPGDSQAFCVRVTIPGNATGGTDITTEVRAVSTADNTVKDTATIHTLVVTANILLVDEDGNKPDVAGAYTAALDTYGKPYDKWDLNANQVLPQAYLNAHANVVWFTGNTYPGPIVPYESTLKNFLDNGGHLFLSGQDLLDQAAGSTDFVHDYLHIDWNDTTQNDQAYSSVTGVGGNPVTGSIGTVSIDSSVLGNKFMDYIVPNGPAQAALKEPGENVTAQTVDTGTYKVMFLAFGFEEYGNAGDKATLLGDALNWFGGAKAHKANTGKPKLKEKNLQTGK